MAKILLSEIIKKMNSEKTTFEVIDDALSKKDFDKIKTTMMHYSFPWHVVREVATKDDLVGDIFYMTHGFYAEYAPQSPYLDLLNPLFEKIKPSALVRIKGNFYPNQNDFVEHGMHIDHESSLGAILYLNNNNGYTKLKNENVKIESKENRLLLFDSSQMHCSTNCTDDFARLNINVNYYL